MDLTRDDNLGRKRNAHGKMEHNSGPMDIKLDPNLGSRKRNVRDEILNPPPMIHKMTKGKPPKVGGQILKEWKVPTGDTGTPWHITDHSDTASMGVW